MHTIIIYIIFLKTILIFISVNFVLNHKKIKNTHDFKKQLFEEHVSVIFI